MIVSESQKQKALFPIVMTLFGIFMLMRDLHDSYLQHIVIQQVLIKTVEK